KKAAIRELKEETGYTGEKYLYLGAVPSNPVFMDSSTHHWLIFDVEKTEDLELDDAEQIEVKEISVDEVQTLLKEHKIDHPHSVSALFRFFEYRRDHQNKNLNV
ncbi:MAG: NUDIX hydrolase, partial [Bacteroidetes bacterium]|nr:NUDIX hydrolase [Bacteroidota bacterium]